MARSRRARGGARGAVRAARLDQRVGHEAAPLHFLHEAQYLRLGGRARRRQVVGAVGAAEARVAQAVAVVAPAVARASGRVARELGQALLAAPARVAHAAEVVGADAVLLASHGAR